MGINSFSLDLILASRLSFNQPLLLEVVFLPTPLVFLSETVLFCHSFSLTFSMIMGILRGILKNTLDSRYRTLSTLYSSNQPPAINRNQSPPICAVARSVENDREEVSASTLMRLGLHSLVESFLS